MEKVKYLASIFFLIACGIVVLVIGKDILAPFVIALIVCYVILMLSEEIYQISFKGFQLPRWISTVLAVIAIVLVFWGVVSIVKSNINLVQSSSEKYEPKLLQKAQAWYGSWGLTPPKSLGEVLDEVSFSNIFRFVGSWFQDGAKFLGLVIIYVLLLFLEFRIIETKFHILLDESKHKKGLLKIARQVRRDVSVYLKIKSFTSALTGVISYLILLAVGVEFAAFWALIIFLLNYIPTIGSIIAVIFPVVWSLLQFDAIYPFVVLIILLVSLQVVIGNIIEPRLMGRSLNLSPLGIILALGVWAKIWGVAGMFLCVPITVIMNIILSKFDSTRPISVLLSAHGNVEDMPDKSIKNKYD